MKPYLGLSLLFGLIAFYAEDSSGSGSAPAASEPVELKHYLIVLRLVPRLHDDKAWTPADTTAVGAHFKRLKAGTETGQVIIAGRTNEAANKTFGLVIFSAPDEAAARAYMLADPCVTAGVMTAELHPYGLALRAR